MVATARIWKFKDNIPFLPNTSSHNSELTRINLNQGGYKEHGILYASTSCRET